ncbi:hypothetical protein [Enemella evansiae]|uniref:hypothetical protein n=1 Tax=Enemella evansiae TaxID=2016499 RepID=UPI000B97BDF6|nr:hypothetical protein [Enemella evansiae]OYO03384.1 hypothetical protein CGZ97_07940 [Enemella evansiae]OYO09803.1 hypothetical protein CGZ98_11745 [Enemella evansiae]
MATAWLTSITLAWHPLLTFERKRLSFLDWVDENIDFIGFSKREDEIGLSLGSGVRLEARRSQASLTLDHMATWSDAEALLRGLMEILQPRHPRVMVVSGQWSGDTVDVSYDKARRAVARNAALGDHASFRSIDTSILLDFSGPGAEMQCELGVVTASELQDRLRHAGSMSRLKTAPQPLLRELDPYVLPDVSVYAGVTWVPDEARYDSVPEMEAKYTEGMRASRELVDSLDRALAAEMRSEP